MSAPEPRHGRWIARLISACARAPFLTLLFVVIAAAAALFALQHTRLDAIPDLSETQVIVFTEWPGQSPDRVEDQVTYPITSSLLAAPRVKAVRGQSMFGMSFVYVIFDEGTDLYWARSRVLEYLSTASGRLPEGVTPTLGPDATGVGWVFQYALRDPTGRHDLAELRSLQDWNLRYALQSVPGVAEVATIGGMVKQYQVNVDPDRLRAYGVTLDEVIRAVRESNQEVGGKALEISGHENVVRGRGYVHAVSDLEQIPVKVGKDGTPITLAQLGVVSIGPDARRGIGDLNGEGDTVGGVVVMRSGENALRVIHDVKARLEEVKRSLPSGVELVVTYDRSGLIERSIDTLRHTLIEEMIVVSLIIFLFLLHVRSALVPILMLPVAVLLAFLPMVWQGLTANIMSLGGIAVAIGAMVDASVILIENVHKRLEHWEQEGRPGTQRQAVIEAMQEVGPSIFFSLLVITVSFIPVFTLQGTEGRLFKPLAFTKTYAMGFAALLSVTLVPALAALFIRGRIRPEESHPINRWLVRAYAPVVRFVVEHRWAVLVTAAGIMAFTVPALSRLSSEFMPPLNEGAILYMPTAPPGMSASEAQRVLQSMDARLKAFPEVDTVFGKAGRAETPTDAAPLNMDEITVTLKPRDQWRPGMTWDRLIEEMNRALRYPGMPNVFWMPIQTRTEMLATGVRSPLGIQVFGDDLQQIERTAIAIEHAVSGIPGTRSAFAERSTGGYYVDVSLDRAKAARYGVRAKDVNDTVMSAIGGANVSETVEGRERYPINVRYARAFREAPERLGEALVSTPTGAQIPLSDVATLRFVQGPPMIRSEGGKLVGYVFVDTDRPIADYVHQAQKVVAAQVTLPQGIRLGWAGQFTYFQRAKERLKVVVPATLALVALLLFFNTRSWAETLIVLLAVPFSLVGAVWLLYLLGYHLSVAVWVGVIALAGLDAETGVVMLLYLTLAHRRAVAEGRMNRFEQLREAIVDGAAKRIRPKLMTVLTMLIGLGPILWSQGTGADVMKRIAAPMVGGLVTSFLLELTVYPAIFAIWKGRRLRRGEGPGDAVDRLAVGGGRGVHPPFQSRTEATTSA